MYVMQSLPSHQQALAGGIFNTLFRLGAAIALGATTAVFTSSAGSPEAMANPMLPYAKAFQVSIGLSAGSFLFLPFVRLGTQGHAPGAAARGEKDSDEVAGLTVRGDQTAPIAVGEKAMAEK